MKDKNQTNEMAEMQMNRNIYGMTLQDMITNCN